MTNVALVARKLAILNEHLRRLRERRPEDLSALKADQLDPTLTPSLTSAAQLRNRIAHGYASLDVERLWTELPTGIDAFAAFSSTVARFLGGEKA